MSRRIAPCPYCGNERPSYTTSNNPYKPHWGRFACLVCGVSGPWGDGIKEATERWNAMPRREETDE